MGRQLFSVGALVALGGVAFALFAPRGFSVAYISNQLLPMIAGKPIPIAAIVLLVFVLVAVFK